MNKPELQIVNELETLVRYGDKFEVIDPRDIPQSSPSFNYKDLFTKLIKEHC